MRSLWPAWSHSRRARLRVELGFQPDSWNSREPSRHAASRMRQALAMFARCAENA